MKTFLLTSLLWLLVFAAVAMAWSHVSRLHTVAQWAAFQSDGVLVLNDFIARLAKQEDAAKRSAMAGEMGAAMREAHNPVELKSAIARVANKYYP